MNSFTASTTADRSSTLNSGNTGRLRHCSASRSHTGSGGYGPNFRKHSCRCSGTG